MRYGATKEYKQEHYKSYYPTVIRQKRYNITPTQYEEMLISQGGVCAICKRSNSNGRNLYVDHDHSCCDGAYSCGNCIRGLLCAKCNGALGSFDDNIAIVASAMTYLAAYNRR